MGGIAWCVVSLVLLFMVLAVCVCGFLRLSCIIRLIVNSVV